MSVIVEDERGNIKLYCKGADTVIFERLAPNQPFLAATTEHLRQFASEGLRTLCLAVVQLDRAEYEAWAKVNLWRYRYGSFPLTNVLPLTDL